MASDTASPEPEERGPRPVTVLIGLGIAVVVLLAASAFLPRWWAHRIGNQADGSFTNGIGLGLFWHLIRSRRHARDESARLRDEQAGRGEEHTA